MTPLAIRWAQSWIAASTVTGDQSLVTRSPGTRPRQPTLSHGQSCPHTLLPAKPLLKIPRSLPASIQNGTPLTSINRIPRRVLLMREEQLRVAPTQRQLQINHHQISLKFMKPGRNKKIVLHTSQSAPPC